MLGNSRIWVMILCKKKIMYWITTLLITAYSITCIQVYIGLNLFVQKNLILAFPQFSDVGLAAIFNLTYL